MTEHSSAGLHSHAHPHAAHPHPHQHAHPQSHPHAHPAKPGQRRAKRRVSRLIIWEWAVVLALLSGLAITLLVLSHGPDPRRDADALVARMKVAQAAKSPGDSVTMTGIPPKVCVLAAWDLYRLGAITINGVMPQRVSAAKLVELCNDGETATIVWAPKTGG